MFSVATTSGGGAGEGNTLQTATCSGFATVTWEIET
jgi:hypothetical protein